MSGLTNKHVLFYSTRCEWSQKLVGLLNEHSKENLFRKVNIDFDDNIPNYVERVPTVIIDGKTKLEGIKNF